MPSFKRLAIVNRGEAAMRAINAVRELNEERDEPIRVIALYTEPERHALFVRQADERHCLGPATSARTASAQRLPRLRARSSARSSRPRPTPPGSAGASSPSIPPSPSCASGSGSSSSGPSADVMRALGDKIEAKRLAEQAGVPVAPWSGGPVETVEEAQRHGERARLPADDQGRGGRRRARHAPRRRPGRARARVRARPRRGRAGVRRPERADGARSSAPRATSRCS